MSVFGNELTLLREDLGQFTTREAVDHIRDKPARFPGFHHELFDRYSDEDAAERWRLVRFGEIIRTIRVVRVEPAQDAQPRSIRIRQWVAVEDDTSQDRYVTVEDVEENPDVAERVLKQIEADVAALARKYGDWQDVLRDVIRRQFGQ